jgi:hypothetical protein
LANGIISAEASGAACGDQERSQYAQERRFAGAIRAEERQGLALAHLEGNAG